MCLRKWMMRIAAFVLALLFLGIIAFSKDAEDTEKTPLMMMPVTSGYLEANSNRQVHPFSDAAVSSQFTTSGFEKVGETDELEIWLNRADAALRILNKETGYLWGALPLEEAEGLNETWRCYGNGLVSIECFNAEGVESRVSIGKNGAASYELLEDGLLCGVSFPEYGIAFQVKVTWQDNKISMALVEGSLTEGAEGSAYTLKSMTFMPFLGSAYSDTIDGYILIPDGSGALIRYRQPANYTSTYAGRVYGKDYGIESVASTADVNARPEAQVLMPVYGMVHGAYQNGFLAAVDSGAEYATILAAPAQTNNPYNWAAARFEFRQKYVKNINRKEGAGASVPQETPNQVTPKISFYLLGEEEANYDGMAVAYRQLLIEQGVLSPLVLSKRAVPMQVEVLGADKKAGTLRKTTAVFTTVQQAADIAAGLADLGIANFDLIYKCYTKNNESGAKLYSALGIASDFAELEQTVTALGGSLYYYLDPLTANEDQITLRTEAANNLSKMEIKWSDQNDAVNTVYYNTYLYRLSEATKRVEKALRRNYGGEFALAQISNKLYSDFTTGKEVTRLESLNQIISMVEAAAGGEQIALYQPNQYLWQYAGKMYDLPAANSQIIYESDSVPFLQIVLSGCVEMYGGTINTSSYSMERLLRQIEYGMAPAFVVTGCESIELFNTAQSLCFSTNFEEWKPQMTEAYQVIQEGLEDVWGHSILSHTCLQNGLIRVEYDNGVCIYLNYTDAPITANGVKVAPGWFEVIRG